MVEGLHNSSQTILEQTEEISSSLGDFFRSLQGDFLRWEIFLLPQKPVSRLHQHWVSFTG